MSELITKKSAMHVLELCRFESESEREYAFSLMEQVEGVEPPTRCIAEVKFDKKDLEGLVEEKANDFLNFLFDMINPNDMDDYLAMYNSQGEVDE